MSAKRLSEDTVYEIIVELYAKEKTIKYLVGNREKKEKEKVDKLETTKKEKKPV